MTARQVIAVVLVLFMGICMCVAQKPAVGIDAGKTKEPISKYIYGQFIEHLGRCIYGGIWAEMLEDRKFFYPVAAKGSPWKALGPPGAVKMSADKPYVGRHTPQVMLSGDKSAGIAQGNLALIAGKEYTGRIILAGDAEAAPVEVSLSWGDKGARRTVTISKVTKDFAKTPLAFKAGASAGNARLEVVAKGKGRLRIGTLSLMPADNIKGFRSDTLKLLKELDSPVYRWPGGNFVSGYNWRDGVGPRDRRPPRKNPAWRGVEHNDVGIHEFIDLCRLLETEPYIAVNTGLGGVEAVGREVQYCNGAAGTPMGKLRAANGRPEPFKVKYWAVGNEMYGRWQKGHMPLASYVKKHNACVDAMRAADPSIRCAGVGAVGKWSQTMLTICADHMELISEHLYCRNRSGLGAHVAQVPATVRRIARAHRDYRKRLASLKGKDIRIALDEWNYWYGPEIYGQLGVRYFLRDALGIAAGLHEFFRNSDIYFMANYAQTVNVIGCIKTSKTAAEFATTGLALKLYRKHFGVTPVKVTGRPEPLDIVAAWTQDRKALTIGIVNPTKIKFDLTMDLKGAELSGAGEVWWITGPSEKAYNAPGQKPQVTIQEKALTDVSGKLSVAPISVLLYRLGIK